MTSHRPHGLPESDSRRHDQRLARRIARVFETELAETDLSGIRFFVRDGHVEIRGLVNSEADQKLIGTIVAQIEGVRAVENRLRAVRAHVYYLSRRRAS